MEFKKENLVKSPLNYTGGKFKLLPQILPLFPDDIDTFVDLFAGGCNVGTNVKANKIIMNDIDFHVIDFMKNIQLLNGEEAKQIIISIIKKYDLSKTNKEGYNIIRADYNNKQSWDLFYTIISHAFNNQIRYNNKGLYNVPFGRRNFNPILQKRFVKFVDIIDKNMEFTNESFDKFNIEKVSEFDFIYCDPPYLITLATYNENGGWNKGEEVKLYNMLDKLDKKGVKFAVSNVLKHKGRENKILMNWSDSYIVHYLDKNYSNCSYQGKNTDEETIEVLITNY